MEKEMKKLLLVAVSVGGFLLVTVAVAILITTPNTHRETSISSPAPYTQGRILPVDNIISNNGEQTAAANIPQASVINEIVNLPEAAIDVNNGDSLTIQIPALSSAGVTQNNSAVTPTISTVKQTPAPVPSASVAANSTTSITSPSNINTAASGTYSAASSNVSAASGAQNVTPSNSAARPTIARTLNDYWIQIGAYSAMVRAEDTRELLADKGLVSIIENREINGQNLFRVRLGPYTSEREANHWLAIVKEIDGFNDSQVRQTIRQQ